MKLRISLSAVAAVLIAIGCDSGCGSDTSTTGGTTNTGGQPTSGSGGGGTGGAGGGVASSRGGAGNNSTGAGGSNAGAGGSNNTSGTTGGRSGSGGSSGGAAGSNNAGGSTAKGGGGAADGGLAGSGGTGGTAGGTTGKGGSAGSGGTSAGGSGDSGVATGPTGPCDIYQSAGTPCGAAHSTVRALYSSYSGPLYQVQRASDKSTKDILVGTGGFADSAAQDSFCSGTTCTIPIIYDQSSNGNHLRVTWFAYWLQNGANPASATAAKTTVGGHSVYGIKSGSSVAYRTGVTLSGTAAITKGSTSVTFSSPQTLSANSALLFVANSKDCVSNSWPSNCKFNTYYTAAAIDASTTVTLTAAYAGTSSSSTVVWNATTKGIATADLAEAEYAVFDGKTYNQLCCFDYGNSEINGVDEGNGTMEAVYYGADTQFGQSGGGSGPWVGADLENGMYEGYENGSANVSSNTSITGFSYVTAMLKGLSAKDCPTGLTSSGCFALKAGNATSGKLEWKWNATTQGYGARPSGYSPQKKQGAVILASGGDGSVSATGIWFEGAVTLGAPPDATDDLVQANIVGAGYGK